MKREIEYIDWLLNIWAQWEIRLASGAAGWPSYSSSAIQLNLSDSSTKEYGTRIPPFNEIADRMNYIINKEMAVSYPAYASILKVVYLSPEKKSLKVIAKEENLAMTTLKSRLHDAKMWLDGRARGDQFLQKH